MNIYCMRNNQHWTIISSIQILLANLLRQWGVLGFDDGGTLLNTNADPDLRYTICIEYEDEQDNDCSTLTLAGGEDKTCTVKNYIRFTNIPGLQGIQGIQ